jgi:acyl-CoA reductase-like NAD-dependent aldehyde dehydrogenase
VLQITFIGSPEVGKLVMRHASKTLTPVILELGGKDVAIVFDDCDYNQVREVALRGTFQNAGQNCAGLERLVVQEGIYDKFVADMEARISKLRVGPPLGDEQVDMGAMTMYTQLAKVQELVDDAVSKGARLLVGGNAYNHPKYPKVISGIGRFGKNTNDETGSILRPNTSGRRYSSNAHCSGRSLWTCHGGHEVQDRE